MSTVKDLSYAYHFEISQSLIISTTKIKKKSAFLAYRNYLRFVGGKKAMKKIRECGDESKATWSFI